MGLEVFGYHIVSSHSSLNVLQWLNIVSRLEKCIFLSNTALFQSVKRSFIQPSSLHETTNLLFASLLVI